LSNRSGAGAAVSAGANFQARVAAYLIIAAISDLETPVGPAGAVTAFSFETFEAIDDLNLATSAGHRVFIQAKAEIDFGLGASSEMTKVLAQFEAQHARNNDPHDRYLLVTTARSSRKVTGDLRAALDAFRTSDPKSVVRDQPNALVDAIASFRKRLQTIASAAGRNESAEVADAILRKSVVVMLDLEAGGSLEEGVKVLLAARNYLAPSAVWGKIVADCVEHARARHTFSTTDAQRRYEQYLRSASDVDLRPAVEDLLRFDLSDFSPPVVREIILGRLVVEEEGEPDGIVLMELKRFADDGTEPTKFDEVGCTLAGGARIKLIRRAASMDGMARMLDADPSLTGDDNVVIFQGNEDDEIEIPDCAEIHRDRLRDAFRRNQHPLRCLNCGKAIFTERCSIVEIGPSEEPTVGLVHDECLRGADRVMGIIRSDFFEQYPELVNFEATGWTQAMQGGQQTFRNVDYLGAGQPFVLAWSDAGASGPPGDWIVETSLTNGDRVVATQRNHVHRFGRSDAEAFASQLDTMIEAARADRDPMCYSSETLAFGPQSELLKTIGGRERLNPIDSARARQYDARFASRFERPGNWYAPLLALRDASEGSWVSHDDMVLALTDPLALATFLENWQKAGLGPVKYETVSILTDDAFDSFMRAIIATDHRLAIDPLFDTKCGEMVSGLRLISIDDITN
jgi:hypothetical protein